MNGSGTESGPICLPTYVSLKKSLTVCLLRELICSPSHPAGEYIKRKKKKVHASIGAGLINEDRGKVEVIKNGITATN